MTNIAGRILIIPKGDYDANASYSMLDLVSYNGTSWLARKDATGIEPSEANSEYWHELASMEIANNLTTEEEGYALDARQGKMLLDKVNALTTIVGKKVDNICKPITEAPTELYSYLFTVFAGVTTVNVPSADGGTINIPPYSKGIFFCTTNNDGCLMAIDTAGSLYVAFRNNSVWQWGRKL